MSDIRIDASFEGPGMTAGTADGVHMVFRFPDDAPDVAVLHAPGKTPDEGADWPTVKIEVTHRGSTRQEVVRAMAEGALHILHELSPQDFPARGGE